jgi:hypothetical protein
MNCNRSGNKWTVNEVLSLQREYELLSMTIQEIALKHSRSVLAILYKLESEGVIANWCDAHGYDNHLKNSIKNSNFIENDEVQEEDEDYCEEDEDYCEEDEDEDEDEDYCEEDEDEDYCDEEQDDVNNLAQRVGYIEQTVKEIKNMVSKFLFSQTTPNSRVNSAV